nr:uncharacterized protein LOC129381742 [Dermacentor andersoni]
MNLTYNLNRFTGKNRGIKGKQMREIYKRGIERIITYASPIWYRNTTTIVKKLTSIQRKPLLALTKAYKTVANTALNVLANIPPVNLRIEKEIEILSTLQGITNPDNLNPYIQKIKEMFGEVNKDHKIILTFIKGHSGNMGNEYADDLAKKAIRCGEKIDLPISKKFISSQLNKQMYNKWNTQWSQEANYHKSYIRDWIKNITEIPTLFLANHNISQFMTGHGRFPHYLQRFRIRQNRMCTCGEEADSFDHYLEKCEITRNYRDKLKMKFGHRYSKEKIELLKDKGTFNFGGDG